MSGTENVDRRSFVMPFVALTCAYVMSQFYRSYVAVIAPQLIDDLHFTARTFGTFSGAFFLTFALFQLPIGIAFDRWGLVRPLVGSMLIGTVGVVALPFVRDPTLAVIAQGLIGVGCAPVFVGLTNFVLLQGNEPRSLAALTSGSAVGMAGALGAAYPLAWASTRFGWRVSLEATGLAFIASLVAVAVTLRSASTAGPVQQDAVARRTRLRYWILVPVCFAMSAGGTFRTSWGGPYLADVFASDTVHRGLYMTIASIAALVVSSIVPFLVTRTSARTISCSGMGVGLAAAACLYQFPDRNVALSATMISALFCVGAIHPVVMSQARSVTPVTQLGTRLGLLNSMVFLGVAVCSIVFGLIADHGAARGLSAQDTYRRIFLFLGLILGMGVLGALIFARARKDS